MSLLARIFRYLVAVLWYGFAFTTVLVAASFGLARLLLPMVSQYSTEVERTASAYAGQPIKVRSLDAEWHGFGPSLVLKGVQVLDKKGGKTIIQLSKVRLGLDLIGSLIKRQINFSSFALIGANLYLIRHRDGHISLAEFDKLDSSPVDPASSDFLNRWIMGQGLISVEIQHLLFKDRMDKGRLFHFANVTVMLRNDGDRHLMDAIVSLPADHSHKMAVSMAITGNPLQGLDWRAKFYATGHQINFRKLFGMQEVARYFASVGESDFEFWGNWDHGRLNALKGEFALQDVRLSTRAPAGARAVAVVGKPGSRRPAQTGTGGVAYDQLTGRIQWHLNEQGWRLQGDRFVVSRGGRVWPASAFDIHYTTTAKNFVQLKANATFVRLQDVLALKALYNPAAADSTQLIDPSPQTGKPPAKDGNSTSQKTDNDTHKNTDNNPVNVASLLQWLGHMDPRGDLRNISIVWSNGEPGDFQLHTELENGRATAWRKIPGASGIKAVIDASSDHGQVRFDSGKASLNMPTLFRNQQQLDRISGLVQWKKTPDDWTISSDHLVLNTVDMDSEFSFALELPTTDRSAFLNLVGRFSNGEGKHVSQYLPAKIMHSSSVDWLDRAIVDGRVASGGVVFHGNTRDFPFRKHQGEFAVSFNLENGVLDYAPQWPRIENIKAEVVFHNAGMKITSNSATIFQSKLHNIDVAIPDMGANPMKLSVKGDVTGDTSEKLQYLQTSPPLEQRFGKYLKTIHAKGSSDLGLNIDFDIGTDVFDARVNGLLDLHDNAIQVDPLGTILTSANGAVTISPDGLDATNLTADLIGQPTKLRINTVSDKGKSGDGRTMVIAADGDVDAKSLSQRYAPVLKELVSGKSAWQVKVDIPFHPPAQAQETGTALPAPAVANARPQTDPASPAGPMTNPLRVSVRSDLKGVESRLPAPFNKNKQRRMTLSLDSEIQGSRIVSKVVLGGLLDGIAELDHESEQPVYRGEIHFGGGPVALPDKSGLRLSGHIDNINIDIWRNLITQMTSQEGQAYQASAGTAIDGHGCCGWLRSADLSVNHMVLYGQTLSNLQVSAHNDGEKLSAKLASKQLSGDVVVPANLQANPIELSLDKLHLTSTSLSSEGDVDPRDLPAIKAYCKNVTLMKRKFGSVKLETTRLAQGLRLEQLVVKPRDTTITANGSWIVQGDKQQSQFDVQLTSSDLGKTMDDLNYVGSIDGGEGTLNATIMWPGPLTDVDLGHLQGNVSLEFNNGRLLEVDPGGAGRRIFGLFSIQTLPRRLILDFSDLFKKGFEFNQIKGKFNITQGDAYTKDVSLDGPGVEAHMSGRIGLASQDYDQKVLVTPRVSDVTALLTLLSSEPILFIVQQLLRNKINQVASFEYRLVGPWDNYKLEPVQKPVIDDQSDYDF